MSLIDGLNILTTGLRQTETRVAKATDTLQRNLAAAQNAVAADSVSLSPASTAAPAVEDAMKSAVLPAEGDVSTALVDLLQAKIAYAAQTRAAQVTGDVVQDAISVIGKREV